MDALLASLQPPTWGPITNILQHIQHIISEDADTHRFYNNDGDVDITSALAQLPALDCFASEKLNGVELSKDDRGRVFHPISGELARCVIHCSICTPARSKDVVAVKWSLIQKCHLDPISPSDFSLTLMGQMALGDEYLYEERRQYGDWRVFGAIISFKKPSVKSEFLSKVSKAGLLAKASAAGPVKIYQNAEFCRLLRDHGFSTPRVFKVPTEYHGKSSHPTHTCPLSSIVERARKYMVYGRIKGLVLTLQAADFIQLQWESAKNIPKAEVDKVMGLSKSVVEIEPDDKMRDMMDILWSVATNLVRNQIEIQEDHQKRIALGRENQVIEDSLASPTGRIILNYETKRIIWDLLTCSTCKFDNIVKVMRRGQDHIGQYYWFLAKETRLRYSEVTCRHWDTVSSNDRVMKYIQLLVQRYSGFSLSRHLAWKPEDGPLVPILFNTCTYDGQDDTEDVATPDCDGLCRERDCDFHLIF